MDSESVEVTTGESHRRNNRMQRVNPLEAANEASSILKSAWQPPCIDYTPEYVRFHCAFPSPLPSIGILMYEGKAACGFIAATGRSSHAGELYLSSFLAFRPGSDPASPIALIRRENDLIRQSGAEVLLFVSVGSPGEALAKCRRSRGWRGVHLGQYRVHAAVPPSVQGNLRVTELSLEQWSFEANRLRDDSILSPAFTVGDLEHFLTDPNGRRLLAVTNLAGDVLATAMQAFTPSLLASGPMLVPTFHYVRLAEQRSDILLALLSSAPSSSTIVTVPNMVGIRDDVARTAGLRGTPAIFAAYLFGADTQSPEFTATDFEIV